MGATLPLLLLLLPRLRTKLPNARVHVGTLAFVAQDVLDRKDGTASILTAVRLAGIAFDVEN